jgi:ubiquinone biosynthesis protein UbiJ
MLSNIMLTPLQYALNRYLQLDPELPPKLMQHEGKVLLIDVDGLPLSCYLKFTSGQIELYGDYAEPVNATISGTPLALFRLGMSHGDQALDLLREQVIINGDTAFAESIKQLLDKMQIDWEEQLAPLFGDVMAHEIGSVAHNVSDWTKTTCQSMQQNVTEYLQEEVQQLPPRLEIEDFYQQVDQLAMDVERLNARVRTIELDNND